MRNGPRFQQAPVSVTPITPYNGGLVEPPNTMVALGTRHYCPADMLLHFANGNGSAVFTDSGPGFFDPVGTAAGGVVTGFGGVLQSNAQTVLGHPSSVFLDGIDDYVERAVTASGLTFSPRWLDMYASAFGTARQACMGVWAYLTAAGTHCLMSAGPNATNYWELIVPANK